jgi:hypothetical protein
MTRTRRPKQQGLAFIRRRVGRRRGAGRKPVATRACVSHKKRDEFEERLPVHATLHLANGLPTLRRGHTHSVLRQALTAGAQHALRRGGQPHPHRVQSRSTQPPRARHAGRVRAHRADAQPLVGTALESVRGRLPLTRAAFPDRSAPRARLRAAQRASPSSCSTASWIRSRPRRGSTDGAALRADAAVARRATCSRSSRRGG